MEQLNQLNLFDALPDTSGVRYIPEATNGSVSGNAWHTVCQTRMIGYGFRLLDKRHLFAGALEFDGWFKNAQNLHVLAEYKERITQRVFKEIVGQARIALMLQRSHRMVIIVLAGHIDPLLMDKAHMLNAAGDDIYLIANPHQPSAEKFLRQLATTSPDHVQSVTYNNLSQRIIKQGGFAGRQIPEKMH